MRYENSTQAERVCADQNIERSDQRSRTRPRPQAGDRPAADAEFRPARFSGRTGFCFRVVWCTLLLVHVFLSEDALYKSVHVLPVFKMGADNGIPFAGDIIDGEDARILGNFLLSLDEFDTCLTPGYPGFIEISVDYDPEAGDSKPYRSVVIFFGLVLLLIAIKVFFLLLPEKFPVPGQDSALSWLAIFIVGVLGSVGILLSQKTGFPAVWDRDISITKKLLFPMLVGLGYGVITVLEDLPHPEKIHMKFPFSIPFYA
jgi:hypothetical protein